MDNKQLVKTFAGAVERVYSHSAGDAKDQADFDHKVGHALKQDYETASSLLVVVKKSEVLGGLMTAYLGLYSKYQSNKFNLQYNRSDQLFWLLVQQSSSVGDESLFNTWDAILGGDPDLPPFAGMTKRYAALDPFWKSKITAFRVRHRRERGSILDLLRAEFERQSKRKPKSNDELYGFDPRPKADVSQLQFMVQHVRFFWDSGKTVYTSDMDIALSAAIAGFSAFVRAQGIKDPLVLFQTLKYFQVAVATPKGEKRTNPKTGETQTFRPLLPDTDDQALLFGLYTIACIQLWAVVRDQAFTRNRLGFTAEEIEYFLNPINTANFYYSSNLGNALSSLYEDFTRQIGQVVTFLKTYALTKYQLRGLRLPDLATTMEIQSKWNAIMEVTSVLQLPTKQQNMDRVNQILADPRYLKGLQYLKEVSSTEIEIHNPDIGKGTVSAGSRVGSHGRYGDISIVYIDPKDTNQIYVELAPLRPQLFLADKDYVTRKFYAAAIYEIYKSTIGIVHITEIVFTAMGFMPVLIEAGFAGLIYEIGVYYASGVLEEQASKINPTFGKIIGFLMQLAVPRPNFKPKVVGLAEREGTTGLSDILNVPGKDKAFLEGASATENRGLGHVEAGHVDPGHVEQLLNKIEVERFREQHSGLPLGYRDVKKYVKSVMGKAERVPEELVQLVQKSKPVRDMISAAEKVKFVQIPVKQMKALPFKFQASTMGSEFEMHVTIDGQEFKLDGIIFDGKKTFIGESKFTYKEAWDEGMAKFLTKGKENPTTSYHYQFLKEKVLPQFERYSELAKRFDFDGVLIVTNTEFMWQTFAQTTEYMKNVEIILDEFEAVIVKKNSRATAASSRGTKR